MEGGTAGVTAVEVMEAEKMAAEWTAVEAVVDKTAKQVTAALVTAARVTAVQVTAVKVAAAEVTLAEVIVAEVKKAEVKAAVVVTTAAQIAFVASVAMVGPSMVVPSTVAPWTMAPPTAAAVAAVTVEVGTSRLGILGLVPSVAGPPLHPPRAASAALPAALEETVMAGNDLEMTQNFLGGGMLQHCPAWRKAWHPRIAAALIQSMQGLPISCCRRSNNKACLLAACKPSCEHPPSQELPHQVEARLFVCI